MLARYQFHQLGHFPRIYSGRYLYYILINLEINNSVDVLGFGSTELFPQDLGLGCLILLKFSRYIWVNLVLLWKCSTNFQYPSYFLFLFFVLQSFLVFHIPISNNCVDWILGLLWCFCSCCSINIFFLLFGYLNLNFVDLNFFNFSLSDLP